MHKEYSVRHTAIFLALLATFGLTACGGGSSGSSDNSTAPSSSVPAAPTGLGYAESADPASSITAYIDSGATNVRNNSCNATLDTNAGVRALSGFLNFWSPLAAADGKVYVDANTGTAGSVYMAANGSCPAVLISSWSGVPNTAPDGTVSNNSVHTSNINYVATATTNRTTAQALAAYLDDRRNKGFSVSDGMGPLTSIWRTGSAQTTTITSVDPTITSTSSTIASDGGNNLGSGSGSNNNLGLAVDFINSLDSGSTEPAKRYYKYGRPWRWSSSVVVVPALEGAKSTTPITDGGFPSGHTAEAWRDTLMMAYLVPQRYQELVTRAMEMGQNRILAGMHSPLDVMGGRVQATAVVAYNLNNFSYYTSAAKQAAYNQAQSYLMTQASVSDFNALNTYAHTVKTTDTTNADYDRFSDYTTNKTNYANRLTYGFGIVNLAASGQSGLVPKGAEVLLETRLPYLSAAQRRVVLKTTEIDSGYPLANDSEGWGRLNLFSAADGYGAFNGDVAVTMNASLGGFNALDSWRNNIAGAGLLTKDGTGTLRLTGSNTYSGGTILANGILAADSTSAFGTGDVYVKTGTLIDNAGGVLLVGGKYTQLAGTLELDMTGATQGTLKVSGITTLAGGTLHVTFPASYKPVAGDTLTVITAGALSGRFTTITVDGFSTVTPVYTSTGLQLKLG